MALRDQMEAAVAELSAAHETNRAAYRAALEKAGAACAEVRDLCDKASASANELGAAKKALEELDRNSPAVEASGAVGG
jgi:hypothetical protein